MNKNALMAILVKIVNLYVFVKMKVNVIRGLVNVHAHPVGQENIVRIGAIRTNRRRDVVMNVIVKMVEYVMSLPANVYVYPDSRANFVSVVVNKANGVFSV